jgi:hypothetical protein
MYLLFELRVELGMLISLRLRSVLGLPPSQVGQWLQGLLDGVVEEVVSAYPLVRRRVLESRSSDLGFEVERREEW